MARTFGQELYRIQREKPWMGINGVLKELGKLFPREIIDVFIQGVYKNYAQRKELRD